MQQGMKRDKRDVEQSGVPITPDPRMRNPDLEQEGTAVDRDTLQPLAPSGPETEPDFTDASTETNSIRPSEVVEDVYYPPTDPVVAGDVVNNREIMEGTFEPGSMESMEVDPSTSGGVGDEALADAVRRELRQDAATAALEVQVRVENGVAYLRGRVSDLDDVDNAEEVANRVPGVQDVIEELEVGG